MTDVTLDLQKAVYDALIANTLVGSLVGDRIYDQVPEARTFPYVSFGPFSAFSDDPDCITGYEITMQIDAWSRAYGSTEVKQVADAVRRTIGDDLTLADNALVTVDHRITRYINDADGLTKHAVITFTALIEQGA